MIHIDLQTTLETFYLCSHLPIKALHSNTHVFYKVGYTETTELIFEEYFSWEFFMEAITLLKTEAFLHYTLKNGLSFTLCPIVKSDPSQGCYILGPYTLTIELQDFLPFKPHYCILHLMELLYQLANNSLLETISKESIPSETCLSPCANAAHSCELGEYSYHISRAKKYLAVHLREAITLDQVVDHLGIGKSYFCRLFRKVTGQTFSSYLSEKRIAASTHLLRNSSLSILEIALQCGFSSASYYTTTFKKVMGQTPLEYRNQLSEHLTSNKLS
ncbi:hypothetical protein CS063_15755 [Sporanaerobium hydrogeniformans]|uniref:Uncharacterized protein n=1 Tax=Sporanaerobium hydrogeniformans TaxID=3072179 RepID=A0AC61D788_9FIRM|nr:AraC family transcriptional regulator [Sporanaerobium hydrogeniformans]PHV69451.1 hypothetical protein CS063_15755 [Sporanaerobium hydrogeniformans]